MIISNEEMYDLMKIVKSLEESGLSIKGVSKTIKNETKEQKAGFLDMLLGSLGASLLRIILTGKEVKKSKIPGPVVMQADEGMVRAGEGTIRPAQNFLCQPILN